MNTDSAGEMNVRGISVQLVRKSIKNLHVGVYPPHGRIRVAAPPAMSDEAIRTAVLKRLPWLKRKQAEFQRQPRETPREYVSGETHHVFGRVCRLEVSRETGSPRIELTPGGRLFMRSRAGADADTRRTQMLNWYRRRLRAKSAPRIAKWAERLGLEEPRWGIRRMKTKWGSCNPSSRLIWLNLELAKKPLHCLDYVILHEMAHLVSPRHDETFLSILDRNIPGWKQVQADLNALPLGHEPSFDHHDGPEASS